MPRSEGRALVLAKGWGAPAAVALLLAGPLVLLVGPRTFGLPATDSVTAVLAPTSAIAGWLVALACCAATREPAAVLFLAAPRRAKVVHLARIAVVYAAGLAACTAVGARVEPLLTSSATFLAEALLVAALAGADLAWVAPTAHLTSAVTLGAAGRDDVAAWAWPVMVAPGGEVAGAACAALLLASLVWGRRIRLW